MQINTLLRVFAGAFQSAASGAEAKEIMGDIENFCDKQPVILAGEVAYGG